MSYDFLLYEPERTPDGGVVAPPRFFADHDFLADRWSSKETISSPHLKAAQAELCSDDALTFEYLDVVIEGDRCLWVPGGPPPGGGAGGGGGGGADHDADSHDEEPGGSGGLGGGVGGHESPDTTTTTGQAQQPAAQSDASVVPAAREKKTVAPPMVLPAPAARVLEPPSPGVWPPAPGPRRNWAQEHEFEYQKEDPYLSDEWSHGFASSNLTAKDVVSGFAAGYELWLVDLGQVTVMAMRRKATSDVVIDIRRILQSDTYKFENLVSVTTFQGFHVFSNNPGAAQRFIDDRVGTAFATMPAKVTAMWLESSWVLAATPKGSVEEDWDAMIQPLALLADAAYVLPPAPGAMPPISYQDSDPTRVLPQAPELPEDEDEPEVTPPTGAGRAGAGGGGEGRGGPPRRCRSCGRRRSRWCCRRGCGRNRGGV